MPLPLDVLEITYGNQCISVRNCPRETIVKVMRLVADCIEVKGFDGTLAKLLASGFAKAIEPLPSEPSKE